MCELRVLIVTCTAMILISVTQNHHLRGRLSSRTNVSCARDASDCLKAHPSVSLVPQCLSSLGIWHVKGS